MIKFVLTAAATMFVTLSVMPPSASASTIVACHRKGWGKSTMLNDNAGFPDGTWTEVREQGYWWTDGWGSCWGRGVYDAEQEESIDYGYCYQSPFEGGYGTAINSCGYWGPDGPYWWNDGIRNRYYQFNFRAAGKFTWTDTTPGTCASCTMTLIQRFYIHEYDGDFWEHCGYTGSKPAATYLNCDSGTSAYSTGGGGGASLIGKTLLTPGVPGTEP